MKKKLLVIVVIITVISVVLGTVPASYKVMKNAIESIKSSSYDLTADIATITLAYFAISDFAKKADKIEVEFYYRVDATGNPTGESGLVYRAYETTEVDPAGQVGITLRDEIVTITPKGWNNDETQGTYGTIIPDMQNMCLKAIAPVSELIEFDRSEEEEWGFFERIFNTIRLTILSIKTVIFAVVVTAVDTISLVWDFISAGFKIVGISS